MDFRHIKVVSLLVFFALSIISGLVYSQDASGGKQSSKELPPAYFKSNAQRTGVFDSPGPAKLNGVAWVYKTSSMVDASPVVRKDTVYVGDRVGKFVALNKDTGEIKWSYKIPKGSNKSAATIWQDNVLFVSSMGTLHVLHASTGKLLWSYAPNGDGKGLGPYAGSSSPVVADGMAYFGGGKGYLDSLQGSLFAVDLTTHKLLWDFNTLGTVTSSPAIYKDKIIFGTLPLGIIYAIDRKTGKELWQAKVGGKIFSSPAVAQGIVACGSNHGLYLIDANSGKVKNHYRTPGAVISSPAIYKDIVYFGGSKGFHAIGLHTGKKIWVTPNANGFYSSPAVTSNAIYVGSHDGHFYALNVETGKVLWRFKVEGMGGYISSSPYVDDGMVFFGTGNGRLYGLK